MKMKLTKNPTEVIEGVRIACVIPSVPEEVTKDWIRNLKRDFPYIKDLVYYNSIEELFPKFSEMTFHVDYVVIDIDDLHNHGGSDFFGFIKTLRTLISCTVRKDSIGQVVNRCTRLIALAGEYTSPSLIKESATLVDYVGIRVGPDPVTSLWTYEDIRQDIYNYTHGAKGIAKILLDHIKPKKKNSIVTITAKKSEIQLTPRQRQIYKLIITNGASNKVIARTLNISESTVKLHTGAILKKYGVQNRTQLAAYAKEKMPA